MLSSVFVSFTEKTSFRARLQIMRPRMLTCYDMNFTRPNNTTAYAVGDLIANDGTPVAMSFRPMFKARSVYKVTGVTLVKSTVATTNANFKVHFFGAIPTFANNDNGVLALSSSVQNYMGGFSVDMTSGAIASGSELADFGSPSDSSLMVQADDNQLIYVCLEARAAYTPAALEVFRLKVFLEDFQ